MQGVVDEKLRLLTYARPQLAQCCVDSSILTEKCPLNVLNKRVHLEATASSKALAAEVNIGKLDDLPLELLQAVIYSLDIQSVVNLRLVNKRASSLIDALPRYHAILRHAPNALRFMFGTQTASGFILSVLYETLISRKCYICDNFGGFLSVLLRRRCCFHCICNSDELLPRTVYDARSQYMLDKTTTAALPVAISLPGRYGMLPILCRRRNQLVLDAVAKQAAVTLHGGEMAMETRFTEERARKLARHHERSLNSCGRKLEPRLPGSSGSRDAKANSPSRFQTVIRFPTLNVSSGNLEWGISCQGCYEARSREETEEERWKLFTNDEYLEHFSHCTPAQNKWQQWLSSDGRMMEIYWPDTEERSHTVIRDV
ncbi:MAG: hypothetical protein Q9170_002249 [Blastenia crenularia]